MHDLVIRGGTVVDGSGAARYVADVAIDGDTIVAVGPNLGKDDENPLFRQMIEIMRTPPKWCADLPLDGEGGTAVEYSK